jgi:hypothetical protein
MKLLGIISVGFDITDQLLIRFSALDKKLKLNSMASVCERPIPTERLSLVGEVRHSSDTGEKKWEYSETVHQLFIEEGSIVQYSHRVWDTLEASQAQ